jgi:predicted ATPase/DNA-binding winged helix-turn-helix (wHTH) protein/Tfp pilus assembly protein PilF
MRFGAEGRFELQPAQRQLLIDGRTAALGGRAMDLLLALASRPTEMFSKAELLARVWPGLIVEENNLRVQVNGLRKLLGNDLIVTVAGRGYRLAVLLEPVGTPAVPTVHQVQPSTASGLPAELDAFVGREIELAALGARLDAGDRLVTVMGTGGAGKTRLVCRYAATQMGDWPGGVYFCDLSEAITVGGITSSVARALNLSLGAEDAVQHIGNVIASRGRCLIVLDNFEQIVTHAAATLGVWMACATEARFIVTSRELLALKGEQVMSLGPLDLGGSGVELFVKRAQARRPDFVLTPTNRHDVARIMALLDGLPLAIELAATRVSLFSPAQLLERLTDSFELLANARAPLTRHATLRASIDWSWRLLDPWEQAALAQCSVFVGAFTLQAAEAVIKLSVWSNAPPVLDVLQSLLDRSLVRAGSPIAGRSAQLDVPSFKLLLSIREYAAAKLGGGDFGADAVDAACRRHGRFYARSGTEDHLDATDRHGGQATLLRLGAELENLVAASQIALRCGDVEVAAPTVAACQRILESKGPFQLGIELGQQLLALTGLPTRDRAHATRRLAQALRLAGRPEDAEPQLAAAMQLYREVKERRGQGQVLLQQGDLRLHFQGRVLDAQAFYGAASQIFVEIGDNHLQAIALGNLGTILEKLGNPVEARNHRRQALAIHRAVGHRRMEAHELCNLANGCQGEGKIAESLELSGHALTIARECEDRRIEGHVLGNRGLVLAELGRKADARRDYEAALGIARDTGNRRFESNVRRNLGDLLVHEGQADEAVSQYELALALARSVGNRTGEARILGHLGQAFANMGLVERMREAFAASENVFQSLEDPATLLELLCQNSHCELVVGDPTAARRLLDRAEAMTVKAGVIPSAVLEAAINALRGKVEVKSSAE